MGELILVAACRQIVRAVKICVCIRNSKPPRVRACVHCKLADATPRRWAAGLLILETREEAVQRKNGKVSAAAAHAG